MSARNLPIRRPRPLLALSTLMVSAALSGCGSADTATDPTTVTLRTADRELSAVAVALPSASTVGGLTPDLFAAAVVTGRDGVSAAVRALSVVSSGTIPVDRTVACPGGGTARVAGALTGVLATIGNGSLTMSLLETLASCAVVVDGRTLLLTSTEGIAVTGGYAVVNRMPAPQQTMTMAGTVLIAVSGSRALAVPCAVDLTFVATNATRSTTVTGSFCGAPVTRTFTWPAP